MVPCLRHANVLPQSVVYLSVVAMEEDWTRLDHFRIIGFPGGVHRRLRRQRSAGHYSLHKTVRQYPDKYWPSI